MINILAGSLVVFAITLTVNKSNLLAGKRDFVQKRYEISKLDGQKPSLIHSVWHAWWTCPMCFGFWMSLIIACYFSAYGYIWDVLLIYGMNWLIHCAENYLVETVKIKSS